MAPEPGSGQGVVSPVHQELRDQSAAAISAAAALDHRRSAAVRQARTLEATAMRLRSTARAELLRRRQRRRKPARAPKSVRALIGFTIEGVIEGRPVRAQWRNGRLLHCDQPLYQRALLLTDLGEELVYTDPPRRFMATLSGRPVAIALTLLRACDRVSAFQVDLPQAKAV
jgi:hypothetical protein